MDRYDIIAIGGGAAGLVTAAGAAGLGARVALIERDRMGGECLWTGCIPSKALLASARIVATVRAGARYGIDVSEPRVDFARVMQHVHRAQQTIAPHDSPERFRGLGVDVVQETATFLDRERVQAGDRVLAGRHVVIATGTRPAIPNIPGIGAVPLLTNENVFELTELPASLIVLGGGAVGVELAQAFALLGSQVTLLESERQLLRTEDSEVVELLRARLQQDGVKVHTGCKIDSIAPDAGGVRVQSAGTRFTAARLLVAAGRTANTDTLALDAAGIAHDANALHVDRYLRTNMKNIWGVGDVTGAPRFTHVADYQARLVIRNALFPGRAAADYSTVPWAIYTSPELAHIGLTEKQARDQHGDNVQVWRKPFAELDRAVADGETYGMVKVVADRQGRILGAHILGGQASTLLGEVALAMKQKVRLSALSSMVHAYPTYPEAVKQVADAYVRSRFTGLAKRAAGWIVRR